MTFSFAPAAPTTLPRSGFNFSSPAFNQPSPSSQFQQSFLQPQAGHVDSSYLAQAMRTWNKRADSALKSGIPLSALAPIAHQDLTRVQQGFTPMSNMQAALATRQSMTGQGLLKTPNDTGGGGDFISNAVSDIGQLASSLNPVHLVPTLFNEVKTAITNPEQTFEGVGHLLAGIAQLGPLTAAGEAELKKAEATPGVRLTPGLMTAVRFGQGGLDAVLQHPVQSALDVAPVVGEGTSLLAHLGISGEEAASIAEKTSELSALKKTTPYEDIPAEARLTPEEAVKSSLLKGHPLQAAYRQFTPDAFQEGIRSGANAFAERMQIAPFQREMARNLNISGRVAEETKQTITEEDLKPLMHDVEGNPLTAEQRQLAYDIVTRPDVHPPESIPPELAHIPALTAELGQKLITLSNRYQNPVFPIEVAGNTFHFAGDSDVAKTYARADKAVSTVQTAQQRVDELAKDTSGEARAWYEKRIGEVQDQLVIQQRKGVFGVGGSRSMDKAAAATQKATDLEAELNRLKESAANGSYEDFPKIKKAMGATTRKQAIADEANANFFKEFTASAPSEFEPIISHHIEQATIARAMEGGYSKMMADHVMETGEAPPPIEDAISAYQRTGDPGHLLSPADYREVKADVTATWLDMAKDGIAPLWVHNVPESRLGSEFNVQPYGQTFPTPGQIKERTMDVTPRVTDIAAAMGASAGQYLGAATTERFLLDHLAPMTLSSDEIDAKLAGLAHAKLEAEGKELTPNNLRNAYDVVRKQEYVEWNPEGMFGFTSPKLRMFRSGEQLYIPKEVANYAKALLDHWEPRAGPVGKFFEGANRVFKVAVLGLSPKHLAHIVFGGTMFLMGRGGFDELFSLPKAISMVKNDEMPVEIGRHLDIQTPDAIFGIRAGKTIGRIFKQIAEKPYIFEEYVTNVQRMMAYLGEERRALRSGMSEEAAHAAGLDHAYKSLIDLESMSPIERHLLRQVFPFYAYTRFLLKYALTYPIDHPWRAAVVNKLATIEQDNWNKSLPTQLQQYFFLGSPDAQGNVQALDTRSLNPFRDLGNMFSLAGFMSQLHPLASGVEQIMGINPITDTPELYPTLHYDPKSGKLQAQTPSSGEQAYDLVKSVIPQVEIGDYFTQSTNQMRSLIQGNPQAAQKVVSRALFLPFTQSTVNIPQTMRTSELAKLKLAQQAVSTSLRTGQPVDERFNYVPYQGKLVPVQGFNRLLELYGQARSQNPNLPSAPRSALQRTRSG